MSRFLANTTALLMVATASAGATATHYLWDSGTLPGSGEEFFTFRLVVDVTDIWPGEPDDWTTSGLEIDLAGGVFYQDPDGGDPPDPAQFPATPALEYDSYYTTPGNYPNATYDAAGTRLADHFDTPTRLDTVWFDTIGTGSGEFVVAQVTVLPSEIDWIGEGHLLYSIQSTGGEIFDYEFVLTPEPSSLVLLTLAGLGLTRRR